MNKKQTRPILSISSSATEKVSEWTRPEHCTTCGGKMPCPECFRKERTAREKRWAQESRHDTEPQRTQLREHPEAHLVRIGVPKRYLTSSFESFQGGSEAVTVCRHVARGLSNLVLWGGNGAGKTHLSVAILRERVQEGNLDDLFVSVPDLLLDVRNGYQEGVSEGARLKKYFNDTILVLDDLGAEKPTDWAVSTLSLIIDRRYRDMLPTVVTTNLDPPEIQDQLGGRISSRLASMTSVKMALPDWRKKR